MRNQIGKKLEEKYAGTYMEAAYVLLVFMWIVAVITAILPVFGHINRINGYANHVARILSVEGGRTADAEAKIEEYKKSMGLTEVAIDYSDTNFMDGNKVQLNDEIVVKIHTDYRLEVIGIPVWIPIETKAVARSEVYYK